MDTEAIEKRAFEKVGFFMSDNLYNKGFHDGMMEAVQTLRLAAKDYRNESEASKKVLDAQANELAAVLLLAWANGIEINAEKALK